MVGCYQRGRIKIFLRNLLGEHKPHFSGDTIRCPLTDIYINHPDELAWTLSLHFQDWFTKPSHHQGPITEADGDWIELGSNKQTFQDASSHLGVPEQYLDLIWAALQTVPNKQELENELNGALSDPLRKKNSDGQYTIRKNLQPRVCRTSPTETSKTGQTN